MNLKVFINGKLDIIRTNNIRNKELSYNQNFNISLGSQYH
jgi:hypothetical protein